MRNFSWKYFTLTGDVESFMLYKEVNQVGAEGGSDTLTSEHDEFAGLETEDNSV
ncbi:YqzL family protein [Paenibacillus sinopodophylli]|uniref:YqzL family protein n=1 Tax=Paenibacillus sinopodophylli TaxID=1837342 RepID=UPI00110CA415|nr:YqzL family protein [Paenibacillus sinopodophylli]